MDDDRLLDARTLGTATTFTAHASPRLAAGEIAEIASTSCIATRIRQLNRIISRIYDEAMRPLGITASQFTLLTQLAQQDGITAREISTTLDIKESTLSRSLKRLFALGLITMDDPLGGRRGRALHLTLKGRSVITEAHRLWQSAQQKAARMMGPQGRAKLDGLLLHAEKLGAV
jgi:DNA-binding MarR family transcriptional regulator